MAELLALWDELLIQNAPEGFLLTPAAAEAGSLLRSPATEEQIAATERRIGRELPPTYREFLRVSNGAFGDYGGGAGLARRQTRRWPRVWSSP